MNTSNKQLKSEIIKQKLRRQGVHHHLEAERIKQKYLSLLFDKQKEVFLDSFPYETCTLLTGRRAGKTYLVVAKLLYEAETNPRSICLYITKTIKTGQRIIWHALKEFNLHLKLNIHFKEKDGQAILPNGSIIELAGADDPKRMDDLLGRKYIFVVYDESGALRDDILEHLAVQVIEPTNIHPRTGKPSRWFVGTPGREPRGFFYRMSFDVDPLTQVKRRSYKLYTNWTASDNPHWPENWLEEQKRNNGWDDESEIYRRQYLGQWVEPDDSMLAYHGFSVDRNVIHRLPENLIDILSNPEYFKVLGVDYGFHDPTAMVLMAFHKPLNPGATQVIDPYLYVLDSWSFNERGPQAVATFILDLFRTHCKFDLIVGDAGGSGMGYQADLELMFQEIRRFHKVKIMGAEKQGKIGHIEILNEDMRMKRVKILTNNHTELNIPLVDELQSVIWSRDRKTIQRNMDDHYSDAFRYGHSEIRNYGFVPHVINDDGTAFKEPEPPKDPYQVAEDEWFEGHYNPANDNNNSPHSIYSRITEKTVNQYHVYRKINGIF